VTGGDQYIDLLNGFRQGSKTAFEKIYQLHYKQLRYFTERIITNQDEAREIVTDTFIKVYQRRSDFDSIQGLRSYLFVTAKNACMDFFRNQKRNAAAEIELEYRAQYINNEFAFENELKAELLNQIYLEIENLPERCQIVFKLLFFKELTTTEAAEQLGISVKTVQNQKLKAIHLLKTALLKRNISPVILVLLFCKFFNAAPQSLLN
jgi:RNA polymerase sigma-70 factor (family 1)